MIIKNNPKIVVEYIIYMCFFNNLFLINIIIIMVKDIRIMFLFVIYKNLCK